MNLMYFAAETATDSPIAQLGLDLTSFIFQLITFLLIFLLMKRFAFKPISKKLEERRQVIEDGVQMGIKMKKEKANLDKNIAASMKDARHEADLIIGNSKKESRDILREAQKKAQKKADAMITDAEERLAHQAEQAKKRLEKQLVGLVSEATESLVGSKVDGKRDEEIVKKALKGQKG
jgi:F-type H+-transporting ATPase subunit b